MAFVVPLGVGTNNQAEIGAVIVWLSCGIELGYRKILLEVDS